MPRVMFQWISVSKCWFVFVNSMDCPPPIMIGIIRFTNSHKNIYSYEHTNHYIVLRSDVLRLIADKLEELNSNA